MLPIAVFSLFSLISFLFYYKIAKNSFSQNRGIVNFFTAPSIAIFCRIPTKDTDIARWNTLVSMVLSHLITCVFRIL